ncbi:hypothetical protein RDI58_007102 [Solanum bulbocastanum]|uniref:COBRA C-terminal domain-containing protein n=1 Tax=Solanum bulbocastanum TaxID=147425 RepID=A0AAN8TU26_SOLBU
MKFFRSPSKLNATSVLLLLFFCYYSTDAFDAFDPNGNITIKWDVISWTPDGYVVSSLALPYILGVRTTHIQPPGWSLKWTWAKDEVIWSMLESQTTEQGNCSKFKGDIPHCCKKDPTVIDLLPETPHNQQIANYCKGGVVKSWGQDPSNSISSFQLSVGSAGTTNNTVRIPKNFTLNAPGPGYTLTWNVTCTYSQFMAQNNPTCCVSISSLYNDTIVPCPTCSCGCKNNGTKPGSCVEKAAPSFNCFGPWKEQLYSFGPVHRSYVSSWNSLACEAQLQGLLEG